MAYRSAMRLEGVGRRRGRVGPWTLREIELALPAGALIRIEGGNGSGKSTLLRLIAGVDLPTTGRITGRPARTGYVPERFPPALPLTARGYLRHLGRVHGLRGRAAVRAADHWLERLGADPYADQPLRELSKGSAQRIAVAQALLAEPALLVLDEAWTGLDRAARRTLDEVVGERGAAGATVVFVDHDPARLTAARPLRYGLAGGALSALAERTGEGDPASEGCAAEPGRVTIEAQAPPGAAPLTAAWPGAPDLRRLPDGTLRLTVSAAHSDALLRTLLTAAPGWHIRAVRHHR
jgi:ABC-2 type transport system ATP-binding protein